AAVIVGAAGATQFTRWKARQLSKCRELMPTSRAWRDGLRLGSRCATSCAAFTTALLAVGMMDVRAMAAVTLAITAERIVPAGARVARATGAIALGASVLML